MSIQVRKFTPSLLDGDTLERLYVERDRVLETLVERVEHTRAGGGIAHVLVVGPRGAGKTHLISLLRHRLRAHHSLRVSWLIEDPYDILSYRDLLAALVERTSPSIADRGDSIEQLEHALRTTARAHGPIVVLAENFDEILEQLGELDQQKLRGLIESERCLQLIVTTTSISHDLSAQPSPFYGFFNQIRLAPFTTDQAVDYLIRRAEVTGDDTFAGKLQDPNLRAMAQRRVQSIEHLAGGHPRIWALLAEGLTVERLDELVHYLIGNFDDITPYYQSLIKPLAPMQRRIVLTLVREDRAMSAKALAETIGASPATITKTLRDLHDRGWVQPVDSPLLAFVDGRITYYELAEPLLRLALEIKDTSRHEIGLIVDFVKLWFDPTETGAAVHPYAIRAHAERGSEDMSTATRWIHGLPTADTPSLRLLGRLFDATNGLADGDGEAAFALPSAVRRALESQLDLELADQPGDVAAMQLRLSRAAHNNSGFVPTAETAQWLDRTRGLFTSLSSPSEPHLEVLCDWLATNWLFDEAVVALAQLDDADPATLLSRGNLAACYRSVGRVDEAIELDEAVLTDRITILGDTHPNTLTARSNLATTYWSVGRFDEAIELQEAVLTDSITILGETHPNTLTTRNMLDAWRAELDSSD